MALPEHSIIINKVARQIFKPYGLERKGQSRTWIDDHGWWMSVVEFQPFQYRKGTCINVGINFHWVLKEYLSFDIGGRESNFVDFETEVQFTREVVNLATLALEKVMYNRQILRDLHIAKQTIINYEFRSEDLWGNYHKGVICGLTGDINGLNKYFSKLLAVNHNVPWADELKMRVKHLNATVPDLRQFRQELINIIKQTRELKKLKELPIEFK